MNENNNSDNVSLTSGRLLARNTVVNLVSRTEDGNCGRCPCLVDSHSFRQCSSLLLRKSDDAGKGRAKRDFNKGRAFYHDTVAVVCLHFINYDRFHTEAFFSYVLPFRGDDLFLAYSVEY